LAALLHSKSYNGANTSNIDVCATAAQKQSNALTICDVAPLNLVAACKACIAMDLQKSVIDIRSTEHGLQCTNAVEIQNIERINGTAVAASAFANAGTTLLLFSQMWVKNLMELAWTA
jgi:hypothetical protein